MGTGKLLGGTGRRFMSGTESQATEVGGIRAGFGGQAFGCKGGFGMQDRSCRGGRVTMKAKQP